MGTDIKKEAASSRGGAVFSSQGVCVMGVMGGAGKQGGHRRLPQGVTQVVDVSIVNDWFSLRVVSPTTDAQISLNYSEFES